MGFTTQVPDAAPHQVLDGFTAVVPGDIRLNFPPHALDGVVVRAVRGQEVEMEQVPVLPQVLLHPPTGVDAVVVEDQVDASGPRMVRRSFASNARNRSLFLRSDCTHRRLLPFTASAPAR